MLPFRTLILAGGYDHSVRHDPIVTVYPIGDKVRSNHDTRESDRRQHFRDLLWTIQAGAIARIPDHSLRLGNNQFSTVQNVLIPSSLAADHDLVICFMPG